MNSHLSNLWKTIHLYFRLVVTYVVTNCFYFLLGLLVSLTIIAFPSQLSGWLANSRPQTIGLVGNYTISSLPQSVQNLISMGLTQLQPDGTATGAAALFWEATDSGKKVTFKLRTDIKWQDGQTFDSSQINYNLKSVELVRPTPTDVSFIFKEPFAPLPVILAQPLFKNGLVGLGDYIAQSVKFNGRFVSQVNLTNKQTRKHLIYKFYPTEDSLVLALKLGAIDQASGLHQKYNFGLDKHYTISQDTARDTVVVLFFNTQKPPLDEKSVRQFLTYALPDNYPGVEKAFAPVPLDSWFESSSVKKYTQNLELAQKGLQKAASGSAVPKLTIQTNKSLESLAHQIAALWTQIGAATSVQLTDVLPKTYDVYLAYLEVPPDPDQYALWHSTQQGNVSNYKSPKIDKLLEEGRRTLNLSDRLGIYSDFQKAITEDVPATFLFYPKIYTVVRK